MKILFVLKQMFFYNDFVGFSKHVDSLNLECSHFL